MRTVDDDRTAAPTDRQRAEPPSVAIADRDGCQFVRHLRHASGRNGLDADPDASAPGDQCHFERRLGGDSDLAHDQRCGLRRSVQHLGQCLDGVLKPRVCRGRPLSWSAMASKSAWVRVRKSSRRGRYWRSRPSVPPHRVRREHHPRRHPDVRRSLQCLRGRELPARRHARALPRLR